MTTALEHAVDAWGDAELLTNYSRVEAISDGVLIDLTDTFPELVKNAGFRFPVACTSAVFEQCIAVPPGVPCQDIEGRAWDLLWMLRCAIRAVPGSTAMVRFGFHVRNDNRSGMPPLVWLKSLCGPGNDGEPVITILFPEES